MQRRGPGLHLIPVGVCLLWSSLATPQTCPCPTQIGTNYRSIGAGGNLTNSGNASVAAGGTSVTFSAALPANVGRGDELRFIGGAAETVYILSRDSAFTVTLQAPAAIAHTNQNYQIRRAYTDLQTWEDDRDGNLVTENRSEVGVAYADASPILTAPVTFDGSNTDATHSVTLTAEPGQRHAGNATTGVILDATGSNADAIEIFDDYVTIEWLVIKTTDALRNGIRLQNLTNGNNQITIRSCVLDNVQEAAIRVFSVDTRADIYNVIIDGGAYGIRMPTLSGGARLRIWNNSIYNSFSGGIVDAGGANPTVTLENNIVMNTVGSNYSVTSPGTANNNTDEDGTAPGANTITSTPAAVWQAPGTNFHLRTGGNSQVDSGVTVSTFWYDVDNHPRPSGAAWDRGADERVTATINYRSIGTAADYTAGTITVVNGSNIVDGSGTTWLASNRGRGDRIDINGTDYVVLGVLSDTQLSLTTPYAGGTATYSGPLGEYRIARQFTDPADGPQDWWDCVVGDASCGAFPTPPNGNLVSQDRSEVGIVYEDSTYTIGSCGDVLLDMKDHSGDAQHHVTLTADGVNRHDGTSGVNARFQHGAGCSDGDIIEIGDGWVTVEWLEIGGDGSGTDGFEIRSGSSGKVVVRHNLIRQVGTGMQLDGPIDIDIYNNFMLGIDKVAIEFEGHLNSARVLNNTIVGTGDEAILGSAFGSYPEVLIQNNIAYTTSATNYDVSNPDPSSGNNISEDGSAPGAGSHTGMCLSGGGCLNFVSAMNLHLQPTSFAIDKAMDLSGTFRTDIDNGFRPAPWDIGADEEAVTTAVELVSFAATPANAAVELTWRTASELNNLGFHLYRATSPNGPFERVTGHPIPGLGSSPAGATYQFRDEGLINNTAYFYELEDIETTGTTERHGPVSATPSASVSPTPSTPAPKSRVIYGEPGTNRLRVLNRDARGLVLELTTNGFYAEPQEDGSVRVSIPDFHALSDGDLPSIPVKRTWIEAIAGRKVVLASIRASDVEAVFGLKPSSESVELIARASGTVRARRRLRRLPAIGGLYPEEAARLLSVGFQGQTKKALVELAPLRWDAATRRWMLARTLVVRISFEGRERSEVRRPRRRDNVPQARLVTTEKGLHRVPYEDVFPSNARGVPIERLRLSRQGKSVPFYVEPPTRRFRRGSTLYFVGDGADANPFGHEAVYELELGAQGELIRETPAAPFGDPVAYFWTELSREDNRLYQAGLVEAPDTWLWDTLFAPEKKAFSFELDGVAPSSESASVTAWLQATSDLPSSLDHHVRLFVNGALVGERTWDGKRAVEITAAVPASVLQDGNNTLELENVGDTGASYSMVMLDRYELRYPSRVPPAVGTPNVSGIAKVPESVSLVLDVTGERPQKLTGLEDHRFRAEAGHTYLMADPSAAPRPAVRRPRSPRLAADRLGADYVVIAPEEFRIGVEPLLSHRAAEGLRVRFVSTEQIYSEFGHGETTPLAIRAFLAHAYHEWERPALRYVLLVGDGTYDYKDFLRTGTKNQVPPLLVATPHLWTASDPTYAAVNGDDRLPDLAIGRLPAATIDHVRVMVAKILAYETPSIATSRGAVLVADDPDEAGDFQKDADAIASAFFDASTTRKIYLSSEDSASARAAILDALNEGASTLSYFGHGGIHLWADENVFNIDDVSSLMAQSQQPLLFTMNCLNGYFHFPYFDSLAEAMVRAEGRGAIAAFSPAGMSVHDAAYRYHESLLGQILSGRYERLGDAVLAGQADYLETGELPELLTIYHLFGDPALRLR